MKSTFLKALCVAASGACCLAANAADEPATQPPSAAATGLNAIPHRAVQSPIEKFRKILAMTPVERDEFLRIYPPPIKERILEKVQEYQLHPVPYGDLRLHVTELRWYLLPLLKASPTNRAAQLDAIPAAYRQQVADRLEQWDITPPTLKEDVLKFESVMHLWVAPDLRVKSQMSAGLLPEAEPAEMDPRLAEWQTLPLEQRQQMFACFRNYFGLSDDEKTKILAALDPREREETEKLLEPIEKWPKAQQEKYFAAFQEFSRMTAEERQQFMKGAARWQKMSETERQAWRDLVEQLAHMPPLPIGFVPPGQRSTIGGPSSARTNPTAAPQR